MWIEILSGSLLFFLFAGLGHRIGIRLFPSETRFVSTLIGALVTIAIVAITGTVVYYVAPVTPITLGLANLLSLGATFTLTLRPRSAQPEHGTIEHPKLEFSTSLVFIFGVIALAAWWSAISHVQITDAVRSPWLVLSPFSLVAPAIALISSLVLARKNATLGTLLLFATLFSVFASAAILYPLGYGFDPFLHRATILHIAEHGTITPKPLYYIGEYALELFAHLLGGISIFTVDTLLVPLLGALAITVLFRRLPLGAAILLIGFAAFTNTTPQSLGYIFVLLTIATLPKETPTRNTLVAPVIFAFAACTAHPIAGIPAFILLALAYVKKPLARSALMIVGALTLPGLFIAQAIMSHANIVVTPQNLWRLDLLPFTGFLTTNGNTWLDAVYLVIQNITLITLVLALFGAWVRRRELSNAERASGLTAIVLFVSFILVALGIDFTYLISYERQDFALRFLTLATFFALPLADHGLLALHAALATRKLSVVSAVALSMMTCGVLYATFPRHDGYARSAAFNVSQADIDTVYAIHAKESDDSDYIVLSNQATAAAALQEFGFRKYYHGDMFYYPIPTGGVMYQYYLSMVNEQPTYKTMLAAMQTAGVHKAYFAVSDYWWQSQTIIEQAKQETDDWFSVDHGKMTVFVFTDEASEQSPQ